MVTRRLISALLIALTISGVFTFWLSRKVSKSAVPAPAKQHYVAAAQNLEAGEILKAESLKLIDWPVGTPLQGAFGKLEDVVGRTVMFPLSAGEPITTRQLSAIGAGSGLAVKIPDGMRAISLKSDQVVGVAGFLLPGTHVDVIVTYHPMNAEQQIMSQNQITTTILQDVTVLAAGQKIEPDPEGKASAVDVVTLLVKPEDAEKAVLGSTLGSVHFVLRNGSDHNQVEGQSMQLSELDKAGGIRTPAPRPVYTSGPRREIKVLPPPPYQVETTLGTKATLEAFK